MWNYCKSDNNSTAYKDGLNNKETYLNNWGVCIVSNYVSQ